MITRLAAALALSVALVSSASLAQDAAPAQPAADFPLAANPNLNEDLDNILFLDLSNGKRVAIRLVPQWAPQHVERIKTLTRSGFYDGVTFHRVIDGFMAQTGDPTGTGRGGSDLPDVPAEFNVFPHVRGSVAMARAADKNSANSQFFIVFYPRFSLDRNYTNFGRVIAGMDMVDKIERGEPPLAPTKIVQATIAADNQAPPAVTAPAAATPAVSVDQLNNSKSD